MTEIRKKEAAIARRKPRNWNIVLPAEHDKIINGCMIFLALFGLLMIGSASMGLAVDKPSYLIFTIIKQVIFLIGGMLAMGFLAARFDLDFLRGTSFFSLIILTAVALVSCLFFRASGGAHGWIRIPLPGMELSIQPSEFSKLVVILVVAAYCGDIRRPFYKDSEMYMPPLVIIGSYMLIVQILQKDFGSMSVMMAIAYFCLLIPSHPRLKKLHRVMLGLLILAIVAIPLILSPYGEKIIVYLPFFQTYQINRFRSALNPFADRYNTGYQLINGLVSFATGGWKGVGFGSSVRKYTDFPAANTDFILSIIVEELGFLGFLLIFIPYCMIIFRLLNYAQKIKSEKAKIILVGTAMYIVIHSIFNIGGVTGLIPLTGVPLLLISAGGSSALALMCGIGLAQAVIIRYRRGEIQ